MPEIPFRVVFEYDYEDGGYIATTPSLASVVGQGRTEQEAARDLEAALDFTVPRHHDELKRGTLRALIRDAGFEVADFVNAVKT